MINQPTKLSQMIRWRYEANERRVQRHQAYIETIRDMKLDCRAEEALLKRAPSHLRKNSVFGGHSDDWCTSPFPILLLLPLTDALIPVRPYQTEMDLMQAAFDRGAARAKTPYPQPLLDQLKAARKERILNKTKERLRESRGEITTSLLKKLRKGPPASILSKMTPTQRLLDKIARSPSEVGFVAIAKRKLKRGIKDPKAWLVEESREKKVELDKISRSIREENYRRRLAASTSS